MSHVKTQMGFERHAQIHHITKLLKYINNSRLHPPAEVWQHTVMQSGKDECFLGDSSGS